MIKFNNLTDRHLQGIPLIHFILFISITMDNNTMKQIKKNFTDMFAEQYKKISELYDAHEKSVSNMIEKNSKMFNERLNNLSQEIKTNYDSIKQLKDNTRDLEESLTVNQDLVEEKLNTLKSQMRSIQNEVSENKAELKEQLRIQEDRSRRNNIRVDSIAEDENEAWENKENKLRSFLYDELEITYELYIKKVHGVRRREAFKFNSNNTPITIVPKFLDYKEKEEVMRRRYKFKDTAYLVREGFSQETVEIRKKLWVQVNKLREDGKYAVIKYDKIVMRDFRPRR